MTRKRNMAVMIAMLAIMMVGCAGTQATPEKAAYGVIATSAETYNAAMGALGDLYKQGLVSDQVKTQAIEYGRYFKAAYNTAIDASQAYLKVENDDTRDKLTAALIEYSAALAKVLEYVQPILEKGGQT